MAYVLVYFLTSQRNYYVEHILLACSDVSDDAPASCGDSLEQEEAGLNVQESRYGWRWAVTRRQMIVGAAAAFGSFAAYPLSAQSNDGSELSHAAESIHQEPVFPASRKRVYEALTDPQQFDRVMRLSGAMRSMATGAKPAEIDRSVGGAFLIFGGYVSGRHIELVPNERIVQAWRPQNWKPGEYSIVKFELVEHGAGTKVLFDHRGFPDGTGDHLAIGWKENYWEPLREYLGKQS
jgi:activator of HSP90 ATPase